MIVVAVIMVVMMVMAVVIVAMMVVVMIVMRAGVVAIVIGQEMRIDFGHAIQVESAKAHDTVECDIAALHLVKAGCCIDLADGALDSGEFVLGDEIDLVQKDHVSERDLLARFLVVLQLIEHVLCVDNGDDGVELRFRTYICIDEERLRHWRGFRQSRCFHEDGVETAFAFHQTFNDADKVAAHRAADAAIVHLEHFFVGIDDEVVVDPDFPEFVHNDGVLFAVLFGQDAVQECGLARAQEACEHGNGNWLGHGP